MARGVIGLARELQLPVIDLLHPMVEVQRLAKEKEPKYTMIPDTVHPDAAGHLVMAYLAMRQIDAPRSVGEIVVGPGTVGAAGGATVANVSARDGAVEFDLELPFLPFYVPPEARKALELRAAPGRPQPLPAARDGADRGAAADPLGRRPDARRVQGGRADARSRPRAARQRALGAGRADAVGRGAVPLEEALRGLAADGAAEAGDDAARARLVRAARAGAARLRGRAGPLARRAGTAAARTACA